MNTEPIVLRMTEQEADSVAHVLMAALSRVSMLPRERKDATEAAQAIFQQLGYGYECDSNGNRVERKSRKQIEKDEQIEAILKLLRPASEV